MRAKLTADLIKTLKPEPKPYRVRDTEITGFLLRVAPSGVLTFYLDYRNPEGKRQSYRIGRADKTTITVARKEAKAASGRVSNVGDPQGKKVADRQQETQAKASTLRAFLSSELFAEWVAGSDLKASGDIKRRVSACFPGLLESPMDAITAWDVTRWQAKRSKAGIKPATLHRDVAELKRVLGVAVECKIIDANPLGGVKNKQPTDNGRVRFLDADEEQRLRDALDAREARKRARRDSGNAWREERGHDVRGALDGRFVDHLQPLVLLAMNTGLRRGELFNLRWSDLDLDRALVTIQGSGAKSGKTRHVPLNREAIEVLTGWMAQSVGNGFAFASPSTGERLNNVNCSWRTLRSVAGLDDFNFHDLRHHFASRLVMASVDLNTVRELLGHADIKMTLRYSHLAPEHKAAAVAALDQPRGRQGVRLGLAIDGID